MSEAVLSFLEQYHLSSELTVFIISMLPLIELRGGIVASAIMNMPIIKAFIICYIGNILPIPFILFFIKKVFAILKKFSWGEKLVTFFEEKALKKSESVKKKQMMGLFLFVAIPLPGTGAWTGALIASLLEMPIKKSLFTIGMGVFCAGIIMIAISYFIPGLFGFVF